MLDPAVIQAKRDEELRQKMERRLTELNIDPALFFGDNDNDNARSAPGAPRTMTTREREITRDVLGVIGMSGIPGISTVASLTKTIFDFEEGIEKGLTPAQSIFGAVNPFSGLVEKAKSLFGVEKKGLAQSLSTRGGGNDNGGNSGAIGGVGAGRESGSVGQSSSSAGQSGPF